MTEMILESDNEALQIFSFIFPNESFDWRQVNLKLNKIYKLKTYYQAVLLE